jgi:hypothetical protein
MSDDTLEHTLQNFDLNQNGSLLSEAKLLTTISHVLEQDYLHIVVQPGELPVNIPTLTSRLITV